MSNAKHTPGPWRVSHHFGTADGRQIECEPDPRMFDACIMTTNSEGRLIAIAGERGSKLNPYDYLPVAESAANMHLIAAAPDLLAIAEKLDALQRQFEFYSMGNKMPGNDLYSGLLMEIVNEARAAIAAAKGEK